MKIFMAPYVVLHDATVILSHNVMQVNEENVAVDLRATEKDLPLSETCLFLHFIFFVVLL